MTLDRVRKIDIAEDFPSGKAMPMKEMSTRRSLLILRLRRKAFTGLKQPPREALCDRQRVGGSVAL